MRHDPADIQSDLAALADGNLAPERVEQVETLALASAEHAAQLAEQRRIGALLSAVDERAPDSLQQTIQAMTAAKPARLRRASPPRWSLAGVAGLAAVALVAIVLALTSGTSDSPSVAQASRLALLPATVASPGESPSNHALLATSLDGIAYPYWGRRFGWKTDGARTDQLHGRTIRTVFYTNAHAKRIGYSIVAGDALALPGGQVVQRAAVSFRVLQLSGATVITWRRAGHTCILTARDVPSRTLLALAGWQRS